MNELMERWLNMIGQPENYDYRPSFKLTKRVPHAEFDGELYNQANGPGTFQRVLMVFPKKLNGPAPAVVVPFYFPE